MCWGKTQFKQCLNLALALSVILSADCYLAVRKVFVASFQIVGYPIHRTTQCLLNSIQLKWKSVSLKIHFLIEPFRNSAFHRRLNQNHMWTTTWVKIVNSRSCIRITTCKSYLPFLCFYQQSTSVPSVEKLVPLLLLPPRLVHWVW